MISCSLVAKSYGDGFMFSCLFQNRLYQDLLTFRNQIAHEGNVAPFLVGANKLLGDLARVR